LQQKGAEAQSDCEQHGILHRDKGCGSPLRPENEVYQKIRQEQADESDRQEAPGVASERNKIAASVEQQNDDEVKNERDPEQKGDPVDRNIRSVGPKPASLCGCEPDPDRADKGVVRPKVPGPVEDRQEKPPEKNGNAAAEEAQDLARRARQPRDRESGVAGQEANGTQRHKAEVGAKPSVVRGPAGSGKNNPRHESEERSR
jgi:hypothetical protein